MAEYIIANTDKDFNAAVLLFKEYAYWLNIDLSFQRFEKELMDLKEMYTAPNGGIVLYKQDNKYLASVAVRKIEGEIAELKRMFVQPAFQHQGIGKALLEKAIALARNLHYAYIRLDTLNHMTPAINLYKKYGFYEIEAYYHNPITTAVYFELKIDF